MFNVVPDLRAIIPAELAARGPSGSREVAGAALALLFLRGGAANLDPDNLAWMRDMDGKEQGPRVLRER